MVLTIGHRTANIVKQVSTDSLKTEPLEFSLNVTDFKWNQWILKMTEAWIWSHSHLVTMSQNFCAVRNGLHGYRGRLEIISDSVFSVRVQSWETELRVGSAQRWTVWVTIMRICNNAYLQIRIIANTHYCKYALFQIHISVIMCIFGK